MGSELSSSAPGASFLEKSNSMRSVGSGGESVSISGDSITSFGSGDGDDPYLNIPRQISHSPAIDVFALGATLYCMVIGKGDDNNDNEQ